MNDSSIALLVPCYNAADFLPGLLADANGQSTLFGEVCCYDDASTDDTTRVAESLGARVLRGAENRGAAYARNRLIEMARFPWLHFHDADDAIAPTYVDRMTEAIRGFKGAVLCSMAVRDRMTRNLMGVVDYRGLAGQDSVRFFLHNIGFGSIGLYHRDWLRAVGGFREDLRGNEDPDLHVRLAAAGCPFRVVDEALVTKLEHQSSFSQQFRTRCLTDAILCFEDYAKRLPAAYGVDIGTRAGALGWLLYEVGEYKWARRGIDLARRFGVATYESKHAALTLISRLFGLEAAFALKKLKITLLG